MSKRLVLMLFLVVAAALAIGFGPQVARTVKAWPSDEEPSLEGGSIPYAGRLTDEAEQAVAPGSYDLAFALYEDETGPGQLWSEVQEMVPVDQGTFSTLLGAAQPIPSEVLDGRTLWLAVSVRGPEENEFTDLQPRQRLSSASPAAPDGPTNGGGCPHTHFGERWQAEGDNHGLAVENFSASGIGVQAFGNVGVDASGEVGVAARGDYYGVHAYGDVTGVYATSKLTGVYGHSETGSGVEGDSDGGVGVYGSSTNHFPLVSGALGVVGIGDDSGVWGYSAEKYGVAGTSPASHGVHGETAGNWGWVSGVYGTASQSAANGVTGWNTGAGVGVYGYSKTGTAGYFTDSEDSSDVASVKIKKRGVEGSALELQAWDPGGGQEPGLFIEAIDEGNVRQFVVAYNGTVAASAYNTWSSDFAEMLPAVQGSEPGDLLVIGPDGKLTRSTQAHQTSVVGVYSTQPGFVGGLPMEGPVPGTIPLAVVGVVPVKVSAENGPVLPGDLLAASSLPGYAMNAGTSPPQGSVIGKALEALDASPGTGIIMMLATLQ